jgi:hypothetical protein
MTIEERLKLLLGEKDFALAAMQNQIEELQAKIKEFEANTSSNVTKLKKTE